ncbi:hypothetical protein PP175_28385 (plasmid) [Aneurinibacillus sp. Ricciae_BoGa-3]|uniref:hypothetical protein n=1 Tax=Aneurinibacillus sp. Ricciae_BoGa-3 TaxID=3022697 RepID=UPI0023406570|nr:hypothetical protein [Aneurinibacillus sp. Ricciae_BoGa-3]WCK57110.1 hypothetical protein PP175_28385 [Aneurinibacillus sp. Ricciae_BoGa-3]
MDNKYRVISTRTLILENEILGYIAEKIEAKEVRKLSGKRWGAWYEGETLGNLNAYELLTDGNAVFIDTEKDGEYVTLSKLFIKEKSKGLGTKLLNLYKDYIDYNGGMFLVCLVINPDFFRKFDWLVFDGEQTFEYEKN